MTTGSDILKKIGSSVVNGTTNPDRTNYFEQVPSNQLETVLWLESDRMSHLLELLTRKSLDNQIEVATDHGAWRTALELGPRSCAVTR